MKKTPTDYEILSKIYDDYFDEYRTFEQNKEIRSSYNYVPIDLKKLATKLETDENILFGRLYYHLEKKFGYTNPDNTNVQFFAKKVGKDMHCIHFPYLASVLASMKSENRKYMVATSLSVVAIVISIIALLL
ncbi:MAG: hypothetical protein IV108_03720 [Burkholderiales bacterium]|nr:hypothetical protein [Burkholderiales bacterium]